MIRHQPPAITLGTQGGDKSVDFVHKTQPSQWITSGRRRPVIGSSAGCNQLFARQTHGVVRQTRHVDLRKRALSTLSTAPTTTTNYVFITTPSNVITSQNLLIQPTT